MNATSLAALSYIGYPMNKDNRTPRITDDDLEHMHAFPANRKREVLGNIMSRTPASSAEFKGNNHYEKTILNLRKDGFRLIDLQPQEFILTSVWCKKVRSAIGMPRLEVAMLLWMAEENLTSLKIWSL